jgi:predicted dehydrogenase
MDKRLRIGLSGAGWMGEQFLLRVAERGDVELAAVYEPNAEAASAAARRGGFDPELLVRNYEAIVDEDRVDAVIITGPNSVHAAQSLAALKAGKHVFCEKPNSTHWKEHLAMIEADRNRPGLTTLTNYTLYFNPLERKLREMIEGGELGTITQAEMRYRHAVNVQGPRAWKLERRHVGDALGMGITHAVFLLCYFLAPHRPVSVYATSRVGTTGRFEVDPIWNLLVTFDDGATGLVLGDIENGNSYDLYQNLLGTRGGFVFDSQPNEAPVVKYWSESTNRRWVFPLAPNVDDGGASGPHRWPNTMSLPTSGNVVHHSTAESLDFFLEHVRAGRKTALGFEAMRVVQDLNFAAQLSALHGSPMPVPAPPRELAVAFGGEPGIAGQPAR